MDLSCRSHVSCFLLLHNPKSLIDQFFKQLRSPTFESPITLKRLEDVARLTLMIDALACEGGGVKEV